MNMILKATLPRFLENKTINDTSQGDLKELFLY